MPVGGEAGIEQANAQKPNPFAALAGLHKDKPPAE
jgi:hypothetical protein